MKKLFPFIAFAAVLAFGCNNKKDNPTPATTTTTTKDTIPTNRIFFSYVDTPYVLILPTAFTPNGDGINDYYGAAQQNIPATGFMLTVLREDSTIVYQSADPAGRWDGRDLNGVADTAYAHAVHLRFTNKENKLVDTTTYLFLLHNDPKRGCIEYVPYDLLHYYRFPDQLDEATGGSPYATAESNFCQ